MRHALLTISFFVGALLAADQLCADPVVVPFDQPRLAAIARSVAIGDSLRIHRVPLSESATLELQRFQVFKTGARIVVNSGASSRQLPIGDRAFFRGTVEGTSPSFAFLVASESGVRGLVTIRDATFEILASEDNSGPAAGSPPVSVVAHAEPLGGWQCGAGELPALTGESLPQVSVDPSQTLLRDNSQGFAVDIAIDTDWELFSLLGSAEATTDYVALLIGAASAVYQRDVATHLRIGHLILWETPDDPWTVTSDLFEALYELGDYWHANHQDIERTTVHWLSGKPGLLGGVAYGGVLCSPDIFFQGHWAGGYGLSGALSSFSTFRDVFVISHELGHNFNSRHTHCYNGIPESNDPPIDHCFSGDMTGGRACYAGATSLPADGGSIMSYCHLQPGGYGNINLWLGRAGSFGERSERVLHELLSHVQSVSCLPSIGGTVFADGFESGDTSAWSGR